MTCCTSFIQRTNVASVSTFSGGQNFSEFHAWLTTADQNLVLLITAIRHLGSKGDALLGLEADATPLIAGCAGAMVNDQIPQPSTRQVTTALEKGAGSTLGKRSRGDHSSACRARVPGGKGGEGKTASGTSGAFSDVMTALRDQIVSSSKAQNSGVSYLNDMTEIRRSEAMTALLVAQNREKELTLKEREMTLKEREFELTKGPALNF